MPFTLTLPQFKQYLKNIMHLELQCYQLEQLEISLNQKRDWAQDSSSAIESMKPSTGRQGAGAYIRGMLGGLLRGVFFGFLAGVVIWFLVWLYHVLFNRHLLSNLWEILFGDASVGVPIGPFIKYCSIIGTAIGFVAPFISNLILDLGRKERKERAARMDIEVCIYREKARQYQREIQNCEMRQSATRDVLKKYYDLGFLYQKYQKLVAVSTIYEYFESGRCFSLVGHEGAYNLYESELRMNIIIEKLDDILSRIDEIRDTQHMLVNELKQCNAQLSRIGGTLDNIENNTYLAQYYGNITASNTAFTNWLLTTEYDKRG